MTNNMRQLQRLLNKVNAVTSPHRHGRKVRKEDLDALSNRQIEVEKAIRPYNQDWKSIVTDVLY